MVGMARDFLGRSLRVPWQKLLLPCTNFGPSWAGQVYTWLLFALVFPVKSGAVPYWRMPYPYASRSIGRMTGLPAVPLFLRANPMALPLFGVLLEKVVLHAARQGLPA